jgi:hypothetical protein
MIDGITNSVENKRRTAQRSRGQKFGPVLPCHPEADKTEQRTGFTKVFRWPVPADQTPPPTTVEVVGTFSGWRKVPLIFDSPTRTWQLVVNNIEGNRTHHYVILVDGQPSYDKTSDGLVAPQTSDEARWGIATPRGPRVMLLFSQTK